MILANSNPATIMTDPDCRRTYVEPRCGGADRHPRRGAPTTRCWLGEQTALNWRRWSCTEATNCSEPGIELIGANAESITAEDRSQFKDAMIEIECVPSGVAHDLAESEVIAADSSCR